MSGDTGTVRRGRPSAAAAAGRRDAMLRAAIAEFLARGFGEASIESIAALAGVTKRTLYTHFGDKAGLFEAAVTRQHAYAEQFEDRDISLDTAATSVVRSLFSDEAVALHRLVIGEAGRFPELAAAFYARGPERAVAVLARAIAVDRGAVLDAVGRDSGGVLSQGDAARATELATALFALLLGEPHRRRLLGLAAQPDRGWCKLHALRSLRALGLRA